MIDSSLAHNLENSAGVERASFSILAVVDAEVVSPAVRIIQAWKSGKKNGK